MCSVRLTFIGEYKYYDMDAMIASVLENMKELLKAKND